MIRTLLVSTVTTLALAAPVVAAEAAPTPPAAQSQAAAAAKITGTWSGRFDVTGSNNQDSGVVLKIKRKNGGYGGTVTHKGFCAGTLTYQGRQGGWFRFTENLTKSLRPGLECTPTVGLKVKRKGRKLIGIWSNNGEQARGTMRR